MGYLIFGAIALFILVKINTIFVRKARYRYIQNYTFKPIIKKRLLKTYPHLTQSDLDLVFKALREYFKLSLHSKNSLLAMPSQVVDVAWHEFILVTREYSKFCKEAFGKYLHHTPTEVMNSKQKAQKSIQRIWRLSCQREGINPLNPTALPLLFAIDGVLNIEDGYRYALNCDPTKGEYCASHVACSSTQSSGSDAHDADSSGCSSGCGGGCGGG